MVSDNQEFEKGKPRISPESAAADIDIDTPDAQFEPDWGNEDSEWGITMSNLEAVIRDLAQRKGEQVECGKRNLEVSILP
jgi:hypothetical protein